ncbi:unnamed protein product [Durusdinium trenchii]|uniref:Uncharacterized protein n=1 Tax=Durusdinium trenchii TaxID=1381693 RepID=A0ABP0NVS5_9DINO
MKGSEKKGTKSNDGHKDDKKRKADKIKADVLKVAEEANRQKAKTAKGSKKVSDGNTKTEDKKKAKEKAMAEEQQTKHKDPQEPQETKEKKPKKEEAKKEVSKSTKEEKMAHKKKDSDKKTKTKQDETAKTKEGKKEKKTEEKNKDGSKKQKKDDGEQKERLKRLQEAALRCSVPAPSTPPRKRRRMKSPASSLGTVQTDASSEHYAEKQAKAMEALGDKLEDAALLASVRAELDATDMLGLLDDLKDHAKLGEVGEAENKLCKRAAKQLEQESEEEGEGEEKEKDASDEESQDGSEASDEDEEVEAEADEQDDKSEEEEEEEEEEGEGQKDADEAKEDEDEDAEDGSDKDENAEDSEEDEASDAETEGTASEDEDDQEDGEQEEEDEEKRKKGELAESIAATADKSTTRKKEWDRFDRQTKGGAFPTALMPFLRKKKADLFGLWLDHEGDWDKVVVEVDRLQSTTNLNRKQWTAIQAKDLQKSMPEDRFKELIKKRQEQGLYYADEDWPEDPQETWYYMPTGRVIRQEDSTSETLKMSATRKVGTEVQAALTGEDGPLQSGALPAIRAASEQGAKHLYSALDDEGKSIVKPKKPKKEKEEGEEVKPKTPLELGRDLVPAVLDEATKARTKGIQLKGMEFADQLSKQLLDHGSAMEGCFSDLKSAVEATSPNLDKIKALISKVQIKRDWFKKAEVDTDEDPRECVANVLLPHEVFGALYARDPDQVREGVNKTIAEVTAWSLHYAALGRYPDRGFYGETFEKNSYRESLCGNRIAGNFKLTYFAFKADLKARHQCHLLSDYYLCKKMCDRCKAIQPMTSAPHPMTYKNMADNAPYVTTCKDHGEYLRTARRITPWIAVEGFQFETISFDVMHLIFLGVARNHVPSVLKLLKTFGYHYSPAESDEKFLQRVSLEMKQDCKDHGFPVQILSPSFLCVWNLCALVLFLARSPT